MVLPPFKLTGEPDNTRRPRPVAPVPPPTKSAVASTLLDPPETAVDVPDGLLLTSDTLDGRSPCLPFRHTSWRRDRTRVLAAMLATGQPSARTLSFDRCGSSFWILQQRASPHALKIVAHRCHDRFCTPCGHDRVEDIRRNLAEYLTDQPHRFLTLTVASKSEPLAELIDHLLDSFRRLRQAKWWRSHVLGGAAFLEIKHNPGQARWHPHLHIICTGKFMPQKVLSQQWQIASRGSYIVDIRLVRSRHELLQYATKYVTKPLPASVRNQPARLRECITALKGRRLIITFGAWARWRLTARPVDGNWVCLGSMPDLRIKAYAGDAAAADILTILAALAQYNDARKSRAPPDQ